MKYSDYRNMRSMHLFLRGSVFLLTLFSSTGAISQDSTGIKPLLSNFESYIHAGSYFQWRGTSSLSDISLPGFVRETRTIQNNHFNSTWRQTEDHPVFHAAYFVGFNSKFSITDGFTAYATLIGEHRGFSYGVNSADNIIVYPQLKAAIDKKWIAGGKPLHIFGSIGNQINPRLYEGLTLYNLYQQGHDYNIQWGKLRFNYVQLTDLLNGIGLSIDDSYDAMLSLEGLSVGEKWGMDIRSGISYYPLRSISYRNIYNLSGGLYTDNTRIYMQVAARPNQSQAFSYAEQVSGLIGVKTRQKFARWWYETTVEGRYYGKGFNAGFKNTDVLYRDPWATGSYANSIGPHFYPLILFDRPFSQWAVFTEYQRGSDIRNVAGLSWQWNSTFFFYKRFVLKTMLDFNFIYAENAGGFLYPFYTVGIGWEPVDGNYVLGIVTNRGMNLDVHYPTFYMYSQPHVGLMLVRELPERWFDGHR